MILKVMLSPTNFLFNRNNSFEQNILHFNTCLVLMDVKSLKMGPIKSCGGRADNSGVILIILNILCKFVALKLKKKICYIICRCSLLCFMRKQYILKAIQMHSICRQTC